MRVHALSLLAVALAASACGSGIQVTTDWDPEQDFSRIQTFAVLDAPEGSDLTSLTQGRIKSAIREAMTAKGLRETSDADIAVGFQAIVDQRSSYQTVSTGWGGYGWGGGWGGMGVTSSQTTQRN
ncbi:MAG: DUF4136 domain-containing protein [Gemmatimonadota bacterium]|nr:DUF4136 domain-containing protein [Gemmatimonadota bacterium]